MDAATIEYYQKYRQFYNKYQKVRKVKLKLNPVCERCITKGIVKDVHEVHHKQPISTGRTYEEKYWLATSIDNLESLCKSCHDIEHGKYTIPEMYW
jgi:5-methylcytosine-specific restriction endonuclease McrA